MAAWAKRIEFAGSGPPTLRKPFPNYAGPEQLGTATYQAYVDRFVADVPVPMLSFDHYPVARHLSLRGEWYQNLEAISAACARRKPMALGVRAAAA